MRRSIKEVPQIEYPEQSNCEVRKRFLKCFIASKKKDTEADKQRKRIRKMCLQK